jgi:KUP system potassium uptake protein
MAVTTVLFCAVARERWRWNWWKVLALGTALLVVDLAFMLANLVKIPHGGWFPLVVAAIIFILMSTWKRGRFFLSSLMRSNSLPIDLFLADVARRQPARVPGTAIFMTSDLSGAPPVLLHHLKHNKMLHERVLLMSFVSEEIPTVSESERVEITPLSEGFQQVLVRYGFMESPDMAAALRILETRGLSIKLMETTFYLGRETLLPTGKSRMAGWRKRLFIIMTRNARTATAYFGLPPNRVVEMGAQIQL